MREVEKFRPAASSIRFPSLFLLESCGQSARSHAQSSYHEFPEQAQLVCPGAKNSCRCGRQRTDRVQMDGVVEHSLELLLCFLNMALILIAEDKPDIRELMRLLVEREGCAVVEAADGREAVERAAAVVPDLILMDLS